MLPLQLPENPSVLGSLAQEQSMALTSSAATPAQLRTVPDVFQQEQSRDAFPQEQEQSQMYFHRNRNSPGMDFHRNSPRWISSLTGTVPDGFPQLRAQEQSQDGFRRGGFRGWRCWGEQGQLSTSPGCSSPTSLCHGQQSLLLPQRRTAPNCGFGSASSLCGAEKGTHRSRQVLFKEVDVLKVV